MKKILFLSLALVSLMACTKNENPLLVEQNTPYGVPAFDQVKIEHYLPAFEKAIAENEAEIAAAVTNCNDYIASQVLATSLVLVDGLTDGTALEMDGYNVQCIINKA